MKRYAITHLHRDGTRALTFANQGRNHFDKKADAEQKLAALIQNNDTKRLEQLFGWQALGTFAVSEIDCYTSGDAGDATGIYANLMPSDVSEGDALLLNDGTRCRVKRGWHGRGNAWLVVELERGGVKRERSVEASEIVCKEIAK